MRTLAGIIILSLASAPGVVLAQDSASEDTPAAQAGEAELFTFAERQTQLVEMARLLGTLHHYHKICRPRHYSPELFRDRMKELITFEDPQNSTRGQMIAAFNQGVERGEARARYCEYEAEMELRRLGTEGLMLSERLARPLRHVEGYDYYPSAGEVRIENGVRVYRGRE